uniref:Uncharacterized protein n=1 Tax=Spongospora subterranea TaxID=70186 RepID=A0A0H5R2I9_9EUKA|eukprot:CRZ08360.1 hypothetical protein [Spongospora subterranea]
MASVFTIVIASMIFLVSGSSDSQGNPLLSSREKDYDAVTKVVNEMFPFLCDNEQCRHGAQLHAKSGSVSDSSEPIDIDVYFLRFVNRILGELVKGIMSNGVPESERTAMTVHLKKKLINVMVAATVFLHNPMQALDNAMSIFKPPSDNAQKAKEVIDRYANMGSHEGLFSDLDLPQHVAHLGQKLVESGADAEALQDLFSVFDHTSNVLRLAKSFLETGADGEALEGLCSLIVYPSENETNVKWVLKYLSRKELRQELISLISPSRTIPPFPNSLKFGTDVKALKSRFFSIFRLPRNFERHLSKLVESGADADALAALLSLFEHSSSKMRLVNLVLRHRSDDKHLQKLFRFFNDFPNAARIVIRAINAGCHIGSAAPLLQDLYKTVHPRYDHYIVSFLFTIATFLQNMHVMNGTWTRVNQTRQILKNYFFNF